MYLSVAERDRDSVESLCDDYSLLDILLLVVSERAVSDTSNLDGIELSTGLDTKELRILRGAMNGYLRQYSKG